MARPVLDPPIADEVPWSDRLTSYDESHLVVYLRLLDASAAGADDAAISHLVLGIDPAQEPARAQKALRSHLARARWMVQAGYRDLLER
jgi:type VI secretion system activator RovC-like protein